MMELAAKILMLSVAAATAAEQPDPRVTPVVLAYRRARPAVVNISAEKSVVTRFGFDLFDDDIFSDVFPRPFARRVPVKSIGSGVLIHGAGYIVTNAHVVRRAQKISVMLHDKKKYAAEVISADAKHDLAILKISAPGGAELPFLPLGRSDDLMVGETVIAIGNPLGYTNTLTTGVISATDRTLKFRGGVEYTDLIQTDAPINPGNSGGPLLNINGDLIGINTAIRSDAQNIGFAVPVDTLAAELAKLLDFEQINRVIFGAAVDQRHAEAGDELYITEVRPDTPAARRLAVGDKIVSIDGKPVAQISDFTCTMLAVEPGQTVTLGCVRSGRRADVAVKIEAKPKPDGEALARKLFGVTLEPITPSAVRDLRLSVDRGLMVVAVELGGPADRLGIKL
ncbi:MAG: trypsin-like peptidase domain-containing protein, partial [Planctomycetota bacterium]